MARWPGPHAPGVNPLAVKQDAINMTILDAAKTITFKQAALEFLATDKVVPSPAH